MMNTTENNINTNKLIEIGKYVTVADLHQYGKNNKYYLSEAQFKDGICIGGILESAGESAIAMGVALHREGKTTSNLELVTIGSQDDCLEDF